MSEISHQPLIQGVILQSHLFDSHRETISGHGRIMENGTEKRSRCSPESEGSGANHTHHLQWHDPLLAYLFVFTAALQLGTQPFFNFQPLFFSNTSI